MDYTHTHFSRPPFLPVPRVQSIRMRRPRFLVQLVVVNSTDSNHVSQGLVVASMVEVVDDEVEVDVADGEAVVDFGWRCYLNYC